MFFENRGREEGCRPSVDGEVSGDIRAGVGKQWMEYLGPDVRLGLGCCHGWSEGNEIFQVIMEVMRGLEGR